MAYIFPLFAFDFTHWDGVILFIIFFGIFGWQCISHNYLCVNVVLDVMKYRVYTCKLCVDEIEVEKSVISKRKLRSKGNTRLTYSAINNDYVIDLSREENAA